MGLVHPASSTDVTRGASAGDAEVGRGGLRRILIALAQRPGLNNRQIGCAQAYLCKARTSGWMRDEGDRRFITDEGVAALGTFDPLPEGQALLDWLAELGNSGAARMLRRWPRPIPKP